MTALISSPLTMLPMSGLHRSTRGSAVAARERTRSSSRSRDVKFQRGEGRQMTGLRVPHPPASECVPDCRIDDAKDFTLTLPSSSRVRRRSYVLQAPVSASRVAISGNRMHPTISQVLHKTQSRLQAWCSTALRKLLQLVAFVHNLSGY
jgi:hypothetical protein